MGWQDAALRAAKRHGIRNPQLFVRQMGQEAHGQDLRSPAGAQGPAQIMPQTAAGWGLSPADVHDLNKSYDAAAAHMAEYERQYGNYKDALVAYNAGPGAVGGHLPAETQNYIRVIMGNSPNLTSTPTSSSSAGVSQTSSSVPETKPNIFATIASLNSSSSDPNNPMSATLQRGWDLLANLAAQKQQNQPTSSPVSVPGPGGFKAPGGPDGAPLNNMHETFYDPSGGWDEGHDIGAIGGHSDHVHVGGLPHAVARAVARGQQTGMTIREYSPIDPVDPVHVKGSWHGRFGGKGAADISGTPQQEAALYRWIMRRVKH